MNTPATHDMSIILLDPASAAAQRLIAFSDEYMAALYPAESNHLESLNALREPKVLFIGLEVDGQVVACGAVKTLDNDGVYGEIKRVFVTLEHRGKGHSKRIMLRLEEHLRQTGVGIARLETGIRQAEAIALYRRLGYAERGPFGSYRPDPLSLFMEKRMD